MAVTDAGLASSSVINSLAMMKEWIKDFLRGSFFNRQTALVVGV